MCPIANNLGISGYSRRMARALEGAPASAEPMLSRPMINALIGQITTITIAGFGADTDSVAITIELPDGTDVTSTVTRAAGVPVDDAAAATALALAINADQELNGHVEASTNAADLILTFEHENQAYEVTRVVVGCTATIVETQAAGGDPIPFGRFVVAGAATVDGNSAMAEVDATTTEWDIVGVTMRPIGQFANQGSADPDASDGIAAGKMGDAGRDGAVYMRNNGSVASTVNGEVWCVVSTAGGDELGEARADDADGTAQVATGTPTAANDTQYAFEIVFRGATHVISFLSDASGTATEIADGLRADLLTHDELDGLIVGTGTATLILTGPEDEAFAVNDIGPGVIAFAATTAPTGRAILLSRQRARWDEVVEPGAIGPVLVNL
jgi:hypothetical protein